MSSASSVNDDNGGGEDDFLASTDWVEILFPTITSLILAVCCLGVYFLNRGDHFLYRIRPFVRPNRRWPAWPRGWKQWLMPLWSIDQEEFLTVAGPDLWIIVALLKHGLHFCIVMGALAFLILMPTYALASEDGVNGFAVCTLAHVTPGSSLLWLPVVYHWIGAIFLMGKYREGWKAFINTRRVYFSRGFDPHEDPQPRYTIMVQSIPPNLCNKKALFNFFEKLFPNEVSSAHVMYDLRCLDILVKERHDSLIQWENAILYQEVKKEPKRVEVEHYTGVLSTLNTLPGYTVPGRWVDGHKYYHRRVRHLSRIIRCWLDAWEEIAPQAPAEEDLEDTHLLAQGLHLLSSSVADFPFVGRRPAADKMRAPKSRRSLGGIVQGSETEAREEVVQADELPFGTSLPLAISALHLLSAGGGALSGQVITSSTPSDRLESGDGAGRRELPEEKEEEEEGSCGDEKARRGGEEGLGDIYEGDAYSTYADLYSDSQHATPGDDVAIKTDCMRKIVACTTGFVTFRTLMAKATSLSSPLTSEPVLQVSHAPQASEVYWENLTIPSLQMAMRDKIASFAIAVFALFFFIPVGVIQYVTSLSSGWLGQYLPVLAALLVVRAVPIVLETVAVKYAKLSRSKEHMERWQLQRHYTILVGYIFASIIFSVIFQSLNEVLRHVNVADLTHNFDTIIQKIGESVPLVGIFFFNYILGEAFISASLEFGRVIDIFRVGLKVWFKDRRLITAREYQEVVYNPRLHRPKFGSRMPRHLIILTICFIYGPIAPLVMLAGLVFFGTTLVVFKHKSYFMFVSDFETGGSFLFWAYDCSMVSLLSATVSLMVYLLIKEGWKQFIALAVLLPFLADEWNTVKKRYAARCKSIPLWEAMQQDGLTSEGADDDSVSGSSDGDEGGRRATTSSGFDDTLYMHPSLKTPREVEPSRQLAWVPPSAHAAFSLNPETRSRREVHRHRGSKRSKSSGGDRSRRADMHEQRDGDDSLSALPRRAPTLQETMSADRGEFHLTNRGLQRQSAFRELA